MAEKSKKRSDRLYAPVVFTDDSIDDLQVVAHWVRERHAKATRSDVIREAVRMAAEQVRKKSRKGS